MQIGKSQKSICYNDLTRNGMRGLFENVEMMMKDVTARRLDVGSRVTWDNNPKDAGTVIEKGFNACKVRWDDPSNGDVSLLHFTEMANIGLATPTGKPRPGETWTNLRAAEVGI